MLSHSGTAFAVPLPVCHSIGKEGTIMDYVISTPCGQLRGTAGRVPGTVAYKGIRYATAGRWEYPKQVTAWEGVYDATRYGACSYQPRAFYNEEENLKKVFYYNEFRKGETYTYSEDCLFLNVFAPDTAKAGDNLPVLVYIHGGGFTGGCGHEKHFDGPVWPAKGVIGVTLNYRLGPMGFACLPQLQEEAGYTGNYGLYDQMCALQWVRDNIASFGGDPDNVTVMGQSAGAMSVQLLCESLLTEGLFCRAVMSSGCGMGRMSAGTPEKAGRFWKAVMEHCGCATLEEFRAIAPERLFEAWQTLKGQVKGGGMAAFPVKDGRLTGDAAPREISCMAGGTSHDIAPPILYALTGKWLKARPGSGYLWYFDRKLPGDENGAWHSSDLWYWFGTLENCWRPMGEKDAALSDQMTDYLVNFVKTGDPNGEGLPVWEQGGRRALRLGEGETRMGKPSTAKMVYTMFTNKAVGE